MNLLWVMKVVQIFQDLIINLEALKKRRLVTYAESHDEERLMYKNLNYGNSSNSSS